MVRSRAVRQYRLCADVFMMDQYPIPNMPLTWLSDSIDEALASIQPSQTVWAVIQAFGGDLSAGQGWPRLPTFEEMRALAYLSVAHGARGIFFYTYKWRSFCAADDPSHWDALRRIAGELGFLGKRLLWPDAPCPIHVEMLSPFKCDAEGRPAVHCRLQEHNGKLLLIAVNVIDRPVQTCVRGLPKQVAFMEQLFAYGRRVVLKDGTLVDQFGPYEAKVFLGSRRRRTDSDH